MGDPISAPYYIPMGTYTKGTTYSGFKQSQALQELKKSILTGVLDKACFWAVELDLSGISTKVWDQCVGIASSNVNIINPHLPELVWSSYERFYKYRDQVDKDTFFHNNQELRNHLAELVSVLTVSPKLALPKMKVWKKTATLYLRDQQSRIQRKTLSPITDIVKISDIKEAYIPLNEINYALEMDHDSSKAREHALFWLSYLLELERRAFKKKVGDPLETPVKLHPGEPTPKDHPYLCGHREVPDIPENCGRHCCWAVWQIIFQNVERKGWCTDIHETIVSLYRLFRTGYVQSKRNSRIPIMIHAILLVTNTAPPIDFTQHVYFKPKDIMTACLNINSIYLRVYEYQKKNPAPNTQTPELPKDILYVPVIQKLDGDTDQEPKPQGRIRPQQLPTPMGPDHRLIQEKLSKLRNSQRRLNGT
jgi:hypothetical protein